VTPEAKRALASVSDELGKLRQQLLSQDKLKLEVDIEGARAGIEKLKALTDAQQLIARIQVDTKEAEAALEKLKADTGNLTLVAKVEADTTKVMADIDTLNGTLSAAKLEIPALVSFDQQPAPPGGWHRLRLPARARPGAPHPDTHPMIRLDSVVLFPDAMVCCLTGCEQTEHFRIIVRPGVIESSPVEVQCV